MAEAEVVDGIAPQTVVGGLEAVGTVVEELVLETVALETVAVVEEVAPETVVAGVEAALETVAVEGVAPETVVVVGLLEIVEEGVNFADIVLD